MSWPHVSEWTSATRAPIPRAAECRSRRWSADGSARRSPTASMPIEDACPAEPGHANLVSQAAAKPIAERQAVVEQGARSADG